MPTDTLIYEDCEQCGLGPRVLHTRPGGMALVCSDCDAHRPARQEALDQECDSEDCTDAFQAARRILIKAIKPILRLVKETD